MIDKLIKRARGHLDQVDQWRGCRDPANVDWVHRAAHYASKAESIIEFLEIQLCGSVGGFDKGQEPKDRDTLKLRLDWVERRLLK